jgi:hypothetical protein
MLNKAPVPNIGSRTLLAEMFTVVPAWYHSVAALITNLSGWLLDSLSPKSTPIKYRIDILSMSLKVTVHSIMTGLLPA